MKIENSNKYGIIDVSGLDRFEKLIGASLPVDYRQFLNDHNGGKPSPSDFNISEEEGEGSIHHFYGLHDGPNYANLEASFKVYRERMPSTMIPIADDSGGNSICLGISGDDFGRIFFWDHESEADEEEQPYYKNITIIANSFRIFLDNLFEWIDTDETEVDKIIRTRNLMALKNILDSGYDIETTDSHHRTIIENAAIAANNEMIHFLFSRGAQLRNALILAENNAKFFDEHKKTVKVLKELKNGV